MGDIETKIIGEIRRNLITAIAIMDEDDKGRMNPEGNSQMLWLQDWHRIREALVNNVNWCDKFQEEVD